MPESHAHANPNGLGDSYCNRNSYSHVHAYTHGNSHVNGDGNVYANGDGHGNSCANGDCHGNCYCYTVRQANSDSETSSDSTAAAVVL